MGNLSIPAKRGRIGDTEKNKKMKNLLLHLLVKADTTTA